MRDVLRGVTDKHVRQVLRRAQRLGCEITITNGGHLRIETPNGPYFTGITPGDRKGFLRLKSGLRQKGVDI